MPRRSALAPLLRQFYNHFYNRFAFTYDPVSRIVSRGEWRAWTRAAIPFLRRPRVLEIAFGTGNLLLDLADAGYSPVGADLSPYMIEITRNKLRRRGLPVRILRAAVQTLPFPPEHFDSIVMTFPPGFVNDLRATQEIRRVLADDGRLIWVDAPYLYPRNIWSRILNWAYRVTGGAQAPAPSDMLKRTQVNGQDLRASGIEDILPRDGWLWQVHRVERERGHIHVIVGTKR